MFKNKIALVTGASKGVGKGIAKALCQAGATVIITGRNAQSLASCVNELATKGLVFAVTMDVKDAQSVQNAVAHIQEKWGALNLLVNNAGVTGPHQVCVPDYDLDDWQNIIQTNISGAFYVLKYALPLMEQSGGGSVVNLSAVNGMVGIAGIAPYTCSKHAIIGLTKSVALEYSIRNIRINAIAPGYVDTENMHVLPENIRQWMASEHPMQRMASVEEVAQTALFLLSESSSFVTGSVYAVDGGYLAK